MVLSVVLANRNRRHAAPLLRVKILASARPEQAEMKVLVVVARKMFGPCYTPYLTCTRCSFLSNKTRVTSLSNGHRTNELDRVL